VASRDNAVPKTNADNLVSDRPLPAKIVDAMITIAGIPCSNQYIVSRQCRCIWENLELLKACRN
jgi:hypothetical protein